MSNTKTMEFFEKIGLPLVTERGDRVFPQSMRAADVTQALLAYLKKRGVKIITGFEVKEIIRNTEGKVGSLNIPEVSPDMDVPEVSQDMASKEVSFGFKITAAYRSEEILAKKIILATGGLSYPTTGSTGDGYVFAKALGHKVTPCFPSLTALTPKNYREDLQGISLKNVEVQLVVNKDVVVQEFGDLDFTNGGIEGPIGFKVSRKGVQSLLSGQKVDLILDIKPAISLKQLADRIERELLDCQQTSNAARLNYVLPKLLPRVLIAPFTATNSELSVKNLPDRLKNWKFEIASYVGYERCVITAGGVSLAEVSQKTMESKLVPGLYFAGEVLDLDGDTGGYNLQIAFSTAALAATSAAR